MKPLLPPIVVNGEVISAEVIAAEAQNHPAPKGKPGLAWQAAARALAIRALMLQEARSRGLTPAPIEVGAGRWETDDEALIRQLLEGAVQPEPIDEAQMLAFWQANPERFRAPALYEAAHILMPVAEGSDPHEVHVLAEQVLEKARANPASFADLARSHSACSSRDAGGILGQISAGDTAPEFEAALANMEPRSLCAAPVRTAYGFHIIRLDARAEGEILPFDAVRPRLVQAAEKAAWARASRRYVEGLIADAEVSGVTLQAA
ncbi:MAG: peptidylprolyl isomerase [Cypionkella sp.]